MVIRILNSWPWPHIAAVMAILTFGVALAGCAGMSDSMTSAFADPAKYDLYECKQLEPERKNLANRAAELQGLMAKAETGVAGPVVAELAYRNEYIAMRGQSRLAEEVWRRNKCHETPATAATPGASSTPSPNEKPGHSHLRSGGAIY